MRLHGVFFLTSLGDTVSFLLLHLLQSFCCLCYSEPEPQVQQLCCNVLFVTGQTQISCSLHFDGLQFSVTVYVHREVYWMRGQNSPPCGHRDKHLKCSYRLCWFKKVVVIVSARFLVPGMISLLFNSSQVQLESCWLQPRYAYHYCTLMVIVSCWLLVIHIVSQLGRTIICFPPLEACMMPSGTMRANPQGRDFLVRLVWGFSGQISTCGRNQGKGINWSIQMAQPEAFRCLPQFQQVFMNSLQTGALIRSSQRNRSLSSWHSCLQQGHSQNCCFGGPCPTWPVSISCSHHYTFELLTKEYSINSNPSVCRVSSHSLRIILLPLTFT